jgi:hypothetical protein
MCLQGRVQQDVLGLQYQSTQFLPQSYNYTELGIATCCCNDYALGLCFWRCIYVGQPSLLLYYISLNCSAFAFAFGITCTRVLTHGRTISFWLPE